MKFSAGMGAGAGLVVVAVAASAMMWFRPGPEGGSVAVKVPELSVLARAGKTAYDANCAQCHGTNASGSDHGPPLVHDIYNPGHHADASFFAAARRGVARHHWNFGDMPPQPQVSDREVANIVRYVRELQLANGIVYRPHRM